MSRGQFLIMPSSIAARLNKTFRIKSIFSLARSYITTFGRRLKPVLSPNSIYSRAYPSDQTAVDLYTGEWTSSLPNLVGPERNMFINDGRPAWASQYAGGLDGKCVLELGPLEGAHTYALEKLGAKVEAIESNQLAFQRCLVAKNILGMNAKFFLGDFTAFIADTKKRYDLVFASGVLYHMQDPVRIIEDLCRISDNIFFWTHYYDHDALQKIPFNAQAFASNVSKEVTTGGLTVSYYERHYARSFLTYFAPGFCGGMHMKTYWMKHEDIVKSLNYFGFEIVASEKDPSHPNGPSTLIFARRIET